MNTLPTVKPNVPVLSDGKKIGEDSTEKTFAAQRGQPTIGCRGLRIRAVEFQHQAFQ